METAWNFVRSGAIKLAVIEYSELPEIQAANGSGCPAAQP